MIRIPGLVAPYIPGSVCGAHPCIETVTCHVENFVVVVATAPWARSRPNAGMLIVGKREIYGAGLFVYRSLVRACIPNQAASTYFFSQHWQVAPF